MQQPPQICEQRPWEAITLACQLCSLRPVQCRSPPSLAACIPVHLQAPSPMCPVEMATTLRAPPAEVRSPRSHFSLSAFEMLAIIRAASTQGAEGSFSLFHRQLCPAAGYYQPNEGAVSCLKCPAGQITANMSTGQAYCTSW